MKLTYSLILAAAASGLAFGAPPTTAYTTPVGYVTLTVPANSDTTIAPPLERATVYAAASTSIAGDVIGATGLTDSAFTTPACYLQVTSGALAGNRYTISANTATSITVSVPSGTLETLGFASGNQYKVVPFWTLNTLFPSGAGLGTTNDVGAPSSYVMFSDNAGTGVNRSSAKLYFYCTGDTANLQPAGWYDNDDAYGLSVGDPVLDLGRMYTIRNIDVATNVTVSGTVPDAAPKISVAVTTDFNDNYLTSPFPVDVSLEDSGLQSAMQGTSDVGTIIEVLFVFDDTAPGINKSASKVYFYCTGDTANLQPAGWYDNDDAYGPALDPATNKIIKAGRCFVIRKAAYGSAGKIPWTTALPYSL